jgi:NUMOD4 motif/HNH endonuclease
VEEWKDIIGFEGVYQISDRGSVRSFDRLIPHSKFGVFHRKGQRMKPEIDRYGYYRVGLTRDGKQKHFLVSRLVAMHFLSPPIKKTVNHRDGNKLNNLVSNLEWATVAEQNRHAIEKLGLRRGSAFSNAKLSDEKVNYIRSSKKTIKQIASELSVSFTLVSLVRRNLIWKHVPIENGYIKVDCRCRARPVIKF